MLNLCSKRFVDISMAEFGKNSTKCYILRNKDKCLIIDPSDELESIKNFVNHLYNPSNVNIFLTKTDNIHGGAAKELQKHFQNSIIYISNKTKTNQKLLNIDEKYIKYVSNGDNIYVDDEKMTVIDSGDSISLYAPESQVVFTGDSFREKTNIKHLLELPQKTLVMPAHDEESSIRIELSKCE